MKIMFFDDFRLGVVKSDGVVDVTHVVKGLPHMGPHDLVNVVIERFDELRPPLETAAAKGERLPLHAVKIRPPLPRPINVDCMAVNYKEGKADLTPINAFHKAPSAIIGNGDTMVFPDVPATSFEGEAEIAVIIGKRAANVKPEDAMKYVFGYTNFIDGSARGLLPPTNFFFQMKSRDTFAPIGPYIVTADEISDPHDLQVRLWVNGRLTQDYRTDDMAHNIPKCIAWISSIHTLNPGDIIAMGTDHRGLSSFQDGDKIELEVEGLGKLSVHCRDELKRTWARETRRERAEKGLPGFAQQLTGRYAKLAT
jgi:2-keto-4-pentenoate hydratase/2-oxohepta-3-ene-1,7-dioic acid hydratase in catechol pathway